MAASPLTGCSRTAAELAWAEEAGVEHARDGEDAAHDGAQPSEEGREGATPLGHLMGGGVVNRWARTNCENLTENGSPFSIALEAKGTETRVHRGNRVVFVLNCCCWRLQHQQCHLKNASSTPFEEPAAVAAEGNAQQANAQQAKAATSTVGAVSLGDSQPWGIRACLRACQRWARAPPGSGGRRLQHQQYQVWSVVSG
eukprot:scaffold63720_cov63-Phaeocystis_antarctica.AAC.1